MALVALHLLWPCIHISSYHIQGSQPGPPCGLLSNEKSPESVFQSLIYVKLHFSSALWILKQSKSRGHLFVKGRKMEANQRTKPVQYLQFIKNLCNFIQPSYSRVTKRWFVVTIAASRNGVTERWPDAHCAAIY